MIDTTVTNVNLLEKFNRIIRLEHTICYIRYVHQNSLLLYIDYLETGLAVDSRWLFELEWVCKNSLENCFTNMYITEMVKDRTSQHNNGTYQSDKATLKEFINMTLPQLIEDKFKIELSDGWHIDGAYQL